MALADVEREDPAAIFFGHPVAAVPGSYQQGVQLQLFAKGHPVAVVPPLVAFGSVPAGDREELAARAGETLHSRGDVEDERLLGLQYDPVVAASRQFLEPVQPSRATRTAGLLVGQGAGKHESDLVQPEGLLRTGGKRHVGVGGRIEWRRKQPQAPRLDQPAADCPHTYRTQGWIALSMASSVHAST